MKILHVNTERGWRGGEQQLLYLIRGLKHRGINSTVACRKGEELEERCRKEGFETIPLSGNQLRDLLTIGIIGKDFDIIHAHAAKAHTISALSKYIHRRPVIYTRRVDYKPKENPLTRLKYKNTDVIVCVVERLNEILRNFGIEERKLRTIYSAVDINLRNLVDESKVKAIRKDTKGNPIIGNVGALTEQKNHENFIEAARIVLKTFPKAVFLILGEGHLRGKLENLIDRYNLKDRVKLLGFKRDIQNYIAAFDLFVLSSNNEGIGGSILQAMVLGKPVVATDAGGVREVVIDGKTGVLVKKRDPKALAFGISRLLGDPKLRKTLVNNALIFARENFSVDKMVDAYMKIYGEVLGSGSPVGKKPERNKEDG